MAQINMTSIMQKLVIAATNSRVLENLAYGTALSKVADRKRKLINKFEEHDVTKEIRAGAFASSKFLDEGNLNSFIGFNPGKGEANLDNVKELFDKEIRVRKNAVNKRRGRNTAYFDFAVQSPTLKQIWDITPYPNPPPGNIVRKGSWMDDIESRGIGGLEYYIYLFSLDRQRTSPASRSGPAIQSNKEDKKIRGRSLFGSISYVRDLMKEFANSL